jgi:pimeloyl-ACP methyl ester carboxylesterase
MIEVDGRSMHVERRGAGEPLLLIMGLSGHTAHWGEEFLDALARDFEVITMDNRGTGRSARADGRFTLAELAEDVAGVLAALEIDSAHLLGISMGGMIAQELALGRADLVRTLTLGCTAFGGERAIMTAPEVVESIREAVMSGDRERAIANEFEVSLSEAHRADPANFERFKAVTLDRPVSLSVLFMQMEAVEAFDAADRLGSLDVPTLVIHGTEDLMLDVCNATLIAEAIPGARLEILDGIGHRFFWEEPQRSAALVREHALDIRAAQ